MAINYQDLAEGQFPNYESSALGYRRRSDISEPSVLSGVYSRNPALSLAMGGVKRQYGGDTPKKQPNQRISRILATVEPFVHKDPTTGRVILNDKGQSVKGIRAPSDVSLSQFLQGAKALHQEFSGAHPFPGKKMADVTLSTVAGENRGRFRSRLQDLLVNDATTGHSLMGRVDEDTNFTGVGDWEFGGEQYIEPKTKYIEGQKPKGQFAYSETIPGGYETGDDIARFVAQQAYTAKRLGSTEMYLPEKVEKIGTKRTPFGVTNPLPGGGLMGLPSEARQEIESMAMGRLNASEVDSGPNAAMRAAFNRTNIRESNPANIPVITNTHELPTGEIIQKVSSPGYVRGKARPIETRGTFRATNFTTTTPPSSYFGGEYDEYGYPDLYANRQTDINRSNIDIRGGGYDDDPTPMLPPPTGNPITRERPEVNLFDESDLGRGYNSRNSVTGTAYVEHPTALAATRFGVQVPPEKEYGSVFSKIMDLPGANEPMLADRSQRRGKGSGSVAKRFEGFPLAGSGPRFYDSVEPDYSPAQQYLTNIGRGLGPDTAPTEEIAAFLRAQGIPNARTPEGQPSRKGTDAYSLGLSTAGKVYEAINQVDEDYRGIAENRRELNTGMIQGDPKAARRVANLSPGEATSLLAYDASTGNIKPQLAKLEPQLASLEGRESDARDRAISLNRKQEILQNYGFTPDTEGPGDRTSNSSTYRNLDLDWHIAKQMQDIEVGKGEWRGTVNELGGKIPMRGGELSEWAASADARSRYGLMGIAEAAVRGGKSVPNPATGQPLVFQEVGGIPQDRPIAREPASAATQAIRYRMANPERIQRQIEPDMPAPKRQLTGAEFKAQRDAQIQNDLHKIAIAKRR